MGILRNIQIKLAQKKGFWYWFTYSEQIYSFSSTDITNTVAYNKQDNIIEGLNLQYGNKNIAPSILRINDDWYQSQTHIVSLTTITNDYYSYEFNIDEIATLIVSVGILDWNDESFDNDPNQNQIYELQLGLT